MKRKLLALISGPSLVLLLNAKSTPLLAGYPYPFPPCLACNSAQLLGFDAVLWMAICAFAALPAPLVFPYACWPQ